MRFQRLTNGRIILLMMLAAPGFSCGNGDDPQNASDTTQAPAYTRQMMVESCVSMHSCGVQQLTRVSDCVRHYENVILLGGMRDLYKGLHTCVTSARGDCGKVRTCFGAKTTDAQCKSTYAGGCDGDVARFCDLGDKRIYRIDCSAGKLTCALDPQGRPFCSAGKCSQNGDLSCSGNTKLLCLGSGLQMEVCDLYMFTCGKDRDNLIDCVGTGKDCKG